MPDLPSVFDPDAQHDDPDAKIVAALERLSQAFRVLLWDEAQPRGLSPVQIRILVHLKHHGPSLRRVGRLAEEFDLAPPTVSDAVSTLEKKGLVRKTTSPRDRRVSILELTDDGERRAEELSGWAEAVREAVARFPEEEKVATMGFLLRLIASLQQAGVVTVARMCVTCRFFGQDEGPGEGAPHYCHLLEKPLRMDDLRVDCPEHERAGVADGNGGGS